MQQRRLRPGDVLDDYCPRERRITEHAIVAMIDDDIKQTRCVACDTEHEYKQARVPARKKKAPAGLFDQVLDGLQGGAVRVAPAAAVPTPVAPSAPDDDLDVPEPDLPSAADVAAVPAVFAEAPPVAPAPPAEALVDRGDDEAPIAAAPAGDEVPFRRSLIRAQLPRIEGNVPTRTLPEFTIRQPQNGRAGRPGGHGRRRSGGAVEFQGPMRSGRDARGQGGFGQGQGQGQGQGRGRGPSPQGGRPDRQGGPQGQRSGRGRRGKKH